MQNASSQQPVLGQVLTNTQKKKKSKIIYYDHSGIKIATETTKT